MAQGVGQPLLDGAQHGQPLEEGPGAVGARQLGGVREVGLQGQSGGHGRPHGPVDAVQVGGRHGVAGAAPQRSHQVAHLVQAGRGRLLDRGQRRGQGLRLPHRQGGGGLHLDRGQAVAQEVVELARQLQPLGRRRGRPLPGELSQAPLGQAAAAPRVVGDQQRRQSDESRVRDAYGQFPNGVPGLDDRIPYGAVVSRHGHGHGVDESPYEGRAEGRPPPPAFRAPAGDGVQARQGGQRQW